MKPIIKVENLYKTFSNGQSKIDAVKNMSLEIYQGEKLAIIGPSGCGKTTLLNMIGLISKPTNGSYYIGNEETSKLSDKKRAEYRNRMFGYVVQDFALIEEESVFSNIEIPLLYSKKRLNRAKRKEMIEGLLNKLSLDGMMNQKVKNLSGGQRQRVAIARAIVNNPQIILADEPTGALDSKNTKEVFEILSSLTAEKKTLILITHNDELAKLCDRQISMMDGEIFSLVKK